MVNMMAMNKISLRIHALYVSERNNEKQYK